jgi:hypothetical protein
MCWPNDVRLADFWPNDLVSLFCLNHSDEEKSFIRMRLGVIVDRRELGCVGRNGFGHLR